MKKNIIKILSLILAAFSVSAVLCGCAPTLQTDSDSVIGAIDTTDTVSACLYSEDEDILLILTGGGELAGLMQGEWTKRDGVGKGKKILSVTVYTQYEVCFFDDGTAMVYYGYCGIFEKDRQYYDVSLTSGLDSLADYVKERGIVIEFDSEGFVGALQKVDTVSASVDSRELTLPVGDAPLAALMKVSWEKRSDRGRGDTVLTLELPMQYGVSFFDDGTAMIYCNELKKGRQYFDVSLDTGLDSLVEYVKKNGVIALDDDTAAK